MPGLLHTADDPPAAAPRHAADADCGGGHTAPLLLPAIGLEPSDLLVPPASAACCRVVFSIGLESGL